MGQKNIKPVQKIPIKDDFSLSQIADHVMCNVILNICKIRNSKTRNQIIDSHIEILINYNSNYNTPTDDVYDDICKTSKKSKKTCQYFCDILSFASQLCFEDGIQKAVFILSELQTLKENQSEIILNVLKISIKSYNRKYN